MQVIEWNDSFSIGVQQFDEHHQHLVGLLNKAYNNFAVGFVDGTPESIGAILDELIDYATYHFAAEEHWMKENSYPKLAEHSEEHRRLSSRVVEMVKDYHLDKPNLALEILTFLNNWLTSHILESDYEYGHYMAPKGIQLNLG
jgi:hemerythrin